MRKSRAIRPSDRLADRWVTVASSAVIVIDAKLARHFKVPLTESARIEAPRNPSHGQRIVLRFEWLATATVTLGTGWTTRGTVTLPTASGSVYYLFAYYDEDASAWEAVSVPDLSATYDAYGAASAAQTAAQTYADNAIAALSTVYAAKLHASTHLPGGADQVFAQGAAISDPSGGVVVDTECRSAVSSILSRLRAATPTIAP